jgi:riboflavin synthase
VVPRASADFDEQTTDWTLKVRLPDGVRQWMVHKGSVAIEGISLTIAAIEDDAISIAILPLTYWRTNLHTLRVGAPVNVESDVLVKLAYQNMAANPGLKIETWGTQQPEFELTEAWLVANGY